ncbi:MAG: hypothetical protein HUJ80_09220, partial [Firmicutes bacterium]|nr:hypothetical protein [Bacillota bacterium]
MIINPQVMAYPSQPAPSASQEPSQTDTQPQQPSQSEPGTTSPETVVTTLSEAVVPPVPSLITDETDENTEDGISQPAQEPE